MATVGGLSASTSSSIRGYGGLASGLDRDTLIEGMTAGTTAKIAKQEQEQQKLEWKQEAIQNISNQMIDFANKYTSSWSAGTNLFSDMLWGRNNITTTGDNSKYVSVSGTASSADGVTIMGVKQLAQNAKWTSSASASTQTLSTGEINTTKTYDIYNLVGKDIDFKLGGDGGTTYTLTLKTEETDDNGDVTKTYDYSNVAKALESIKSQMEKIDVTIGGATKHLSDVVEIDVNEDGKITIKNTGSARNALSITSGTALSYLGFENKSYDLGSESGGTIITAGNEQNIVTPVNFEQKIAGKSLTFSYNGTNKTITMPSLEDFNGKTTPSEKLEVIQSSLQDQLDAAFGKGRIAVEIPDSGDTITFRTTIPPSAGESDDPSTFKTDTTSTFTLVSGNEDVKEVLGLKTGMSNRVNMSGQLSSYKLNFDMSETVEDEDGNPVMDEDGNPETRKYTTFSINGESIKVYADDTMASLMARINSSDAGVTVTYQQAADKFTFTSKDEGASGSIKIDSDAVTQELFGITSNVDKHGQDAIVAVKYAGSDEEVVLRRGSNSFTLDGLTINVKGTFGYEGETLIKDDPDTVVEISAQVNADSIVDAVKSMIEEYNAIIDLVNKEMTTKPDSDYAPLTSDQKSELSESEIETWEKKAKEGMLYGDSDIRNLSMDLRFIIDGGIAQELSEMGIATSSTYSENGKLTFDESKFRAALASNPERVQQLFAGSSVENTNGNGFSSGIATNLKSVMDKYVNTLGAMESKGILIRKAGSASSPMSVTDNTIYKQLAEIKEKIAKLQTQLETERDRYISQFTSLETLISQMNSQSSWLSQLGGF